MTLSSLLRKVSCQVSYDHVSVFSKMVVVMSGNPMRYRQGVVNSTSFQKYVLIGASKTLLSVPISLS